MRILALALLTIVTLSANGAARAQTYDPDFPVCMHVIVPPGGSFEDCSYYTKEQCRASAAGRAGQCDFNPFYRGLLGRRR
jgi:hypothetical protein